MEYRRDYPLDQPCDVLVISFAGLQASRRKNDSRFEFVHSLTKAAQGRCIHALFLVDTEQTWFLRANSRDAFDEVVHEMQQEVSQLCPRRIVTVGASMGGYAAIRVGLAIGASSVLAFGPQVYLCPQERVQFVGETPDFFAADLHRCATSGLQMESLITAMARCDSSASHLVEVHCGAEAASDVREARLLQEALPSVRVCVHCGVGHGITIALKGNGMLVGMLRRHLAGSPYPEAAWSLKGSGLTDDDLTDAEQDIDARFHQISLAYGDLRCIHNDPAIYAVPHFFAPAECKRLIEKATTRGMVGASASSQTGAVRTCSVCAVPQREVPTLVQKVLTLLQCNNPRQLARCNVLRYEAGERYEVHTDETNDGAPDASDGFDQSMRLVTIFVYLNDVACGGATRFTALGLDVRPTCGLALVHFPGTLHGFRTDIRTAHEALPAVDRKWACVFWLNAFERSSDVSKWGPKAWPEDRMIPALTEDVI
mmetsp:Transcript_66307/g.110153  ORF Transcript_66307/g.110153 Transcript_66307/m.110153 type:complete len:483 (+) Transcript_66307:14-1462(+)|eukprot:CAMPEP_0119319196 /NCGR_PEP_ID=MMETSP1333-20130426/48713_1 /TAXON_ID=418940 /ORGANISM="Scyphosphaera apsteinii, Strain RCC1455" /LENGTH=482 /DNA_ID=CAMNT_0007325547 /DNA_START=13 /DNA_END=1461 /DNA_ORIENTATION=-